MSDTSPFNGESSRDAGQHMSDDHHSLHRGQKACQACRIAKVKCHEVIGDQACARCQSAAITCVFPPSRRGRVKGSKNKKTLEKLANHGQTSALSDDSKPDTTSLWGDEDIKWSFQQSASSATPAIDESPESRPASPFDPFVTRPATPADEPSSSRPVKKARFSRHTLEALEKTFPTGIERDVAEPPSHHISPSQQDLQNPLHFLAECARRGWDSQSRYTEPLVIPRPPTGLPWEDQILLDQWKSGDLQRLVQDQRTFFQHGLYGSKRDVSAGLDAVQRGVISEDQVAELFASYFKTVHPGFPLLDERLHTPTFVRARSAYLFTVILAVGATSIAILPHATHAQARRALDLRAHVEKLQLVLCATAAKSVEIIQAELLLQSLGLRKPRLVDDQRWTRLGMCYRMASLIGLFRPSTSKIDDIDHDPLAMNDFRLRVCMILLESRWESISDRKPISPELSELNDKEFEKLNRTDPLSQDALLASDYALHRFELESKERIDRIPSGSRSSTNFDSERVWIKTYIAEWERKWVHPQVEPLRRWYFQYTSHRSLLVGLLRIAKRQSASGKWTTTMRHEVLDVSVRMLEDALRHERSLHMFRTTSPVVFACTIVLQLSERGHPARDLILRVALRLAGNPRGEVVTYGKHNGLQILNMLCLSKETADQRRASVSPKVSAGIDPISSLQQTLLAPTGPTLQQPMPVADGDSFSSGWTDLDQLLGYSGNVDFPYFPGTTPNALPHPATGDPAFAQWNDLFSGLASANTWDQQQGFSEAGPAVMEGSNAWGGTLGFKDHDGQFAQDGRANDLFQHMASALSG